VNISLRLLCEKAQDFIMQVFGFRGKTLPQTEGKKLMKLIQTIDNEATTKRDKAC
jgi:hypothetical protein